MEIEKETYDNLESLARAFLSPEGKEVNNPKPLFLELTPKKMSAREEIQRILRVELSHQAQMQGQETYEEANDFDIDEDFDKEELQTKYTIMEEEYLPVEEIQNNNGNGIKPEEKPEKPEEKPEESPETET